MTIELLLDAKKEDINMRKKKESDLAASGFDPESLKIVSIEFRIRST